MYVAYKFVSLVWCLCQVQLLCFCSTLVSFLNMSGRTLKELLFGELVRYSVIFVYEWHMHTSISSRTFSNFQNSLIWWLACISYPIWWYYQWHMHTSIFSRTFCKQCVIHFITWFFNCSVCINYSRGEFLCLYERYPTYLGTVCYDLATAQPTADGQCKSSVVEHNSLSLRKISYLQCKSLWGYMFWYS